MLKKIADDFAASGTIDDQAGFVEGLDPTILQNAQNDAQAALEDHIQNELPDDATVADVIGGRQIRSQQFETLPASIPNRLVTTGARYDALPQDLQHRLVVGLDTDIFGEPTNAVRLPWAQVNGAQLSLAFSPATEEDRQALEGLLPDGEITDPSQLPDSIPSSLIRLTPEIRLDGTVIKTGAAMRPGAELDLAFKVIRRGFGPDTNSSPVVAGSFLHIAAAGGSVAPKDLDNLQGRIQETKAKLESGDDQQLASLTRNDLLGDLFHAGGLAYFGQFDALSQIQARQQDARQNLAPSVGTYGYVPKVATLFGIPKAIEPGGVEMDLDRVAWTQGAKQSAPTDRRQRNIQAGALSSALEHAVPEQMFSTQDNPVEAVSAVKALSIANREGQKIYRIDASNRDTVLPKLSLGRNTMDEIRTALDAGKVVTTHPQQIAVPGWSGAGYVILDPDTGAGAWKIGGGINGGFQALKDAVTVGVAALFGFLNAELGGFAGKAFLFSDKLKYLAKLAKTTRLLGVVGLLIDVAFILFDSNLSAIDKLARISIALLNFGITSAITASAIALLGPAAIATIFAAVLTAVAMTLSLLLIQRMYFSANSTGSRYRWA